MKYPGHGFYICPKINVDTDMEPVFTLRPVLNLSHLQIEFDFDRTWNILKEYQSKQWDMPKRYFHDFYDDCYLRNPISGRNLNFSYYNGRFGFGTPDTEYEDMYEEDFDTVGFDYEYSESFAHRLERLVIRW